MIPRFTRIGPPCHLSVTTAATRVYFTAYGDIYTAPGSFFAVDLALPLTLGARRSEIHSRSTNPRTIRVYPTERVALLRLMRPRKELVTPPGIEPGPPDCKSGILTTRLRSHFPDLFQKPACALSNLTSIIFRIKRKNCKLASW